MDTSDNDHISKWTSKNAPLPGAIFNFDGPASDDKKEALLLQNGFIPTRAFEEVGKDFGVRCARAFTHTIAVGGIAIDVMLPDAIRAIKYLSQGYKRVFLLCNSSFDLGTFVDLKNLLAVGIKVKLLVIEHNSSNSYNTIHTMCQKVVQDILAGRYDHGF